MSTPSLAVKITLCDGSKEGRAELLAKAELVVGDSFVIKDIRVLRVPSKLDGSPRIFVSFPQRKARDTQLWFDIVHPITPAAHREATGLILSEYKRISAAAAAASKTVRADTLPL